MSRVRVAAVVLMLVVWGAALGGCGPAAENGETSGSAAAPALEPAGTWWEFTEAGLAVCYYDEVRETLIPLPEEILSALNANDPAIAVASTVYVTRQRIALAYNAPEEQANGDTWYWAQVWQTEDQGVNWSHCTLPAVAENPTAYGGNNFFHFALGFTSAAEGWLIASGSRANEGGANYVYTTHDGGVSWSETNHVNAEFPRLLTCGAFADADTGFLCFSNGYYKDTGQGWAFTTYQPEFYGVATTDGGRSWAPFTLPLPEPPGPMDEDQVVRIEFYGDGGSMWVARRAADFWSTGQQREILRLTTADRGRTWDYDAAAQDQQTVPLQTFTATIIGQLPTAVAKDSFAAAPVNLLAALPEKNLYLYSRLEYGNDGQRYPVVWLRQGNRFAEWDWVYSTPRGVLPQMACYDIDHDGTDEVAVVLYVASGTGMAIEELHIVEFAADGTVTDQVLPETLYSVDLMDKISWETDSEHLTLTIDEQRVQVPLANLPLEGTAQGEEDAASIRGVKLGDIVYFSVDGQAIQARLGVGIECSESGVIPVYTHDLYATVTYEDGAFACRDFYWQSYQLPVKFGND